jgi:hypothetical protein
MLTVAIADRMTHCSHIVDANFECQMAQFLIAFRTFAYLY